MLQAEPNFVWCKSATCEWGQLHESGAAAPIVICQVCDTRSCFTHDVPWHAEKTCAQYDAEQAGRARQAQDNLASEAYIQQHAKACPNAACGRNIEKNDGCDHMTCRRPAGCGHEFCWVCFADYAPIRNEGNHHHNSSCRYYAPIVDRASQLHAVPVPPNPLVPPVVRHAHRTPPAPVHNVPVQPPAYLMQLHRAPTPPPPRVIGYRVNVARYIAPTAQSTIPAPTPAPAPARPTSWWGWLFGSRATAVAAA
ncbi:hypothetical protein BDV93DRAFT_473140 [Ceratobasidium sp. AG-I]|nr:hypothetical protein BDV93DRAFT_473140 [Ceratobasidium sp. AG-I]